MQVGAAPHHQPTSTSTSTSTVCAFRRSAPPTSERGSPRFCTRAAVRLRLVFCVSWVVGAAHTWGGPMDQCHPCRGGHACGARCSERGHRRVRSKWQNGSPLALGAVLCPAPGGRFKPGRPEASGGPWRHRSSATRSSRPASLGRRGGESTREGKFKAPACLGRGNSRTPLLHARGSVSFARQPAGAARWTLEDGLDVVEALCQEQRQPATPPKHCACEPERRLAHFHAQTLVGEVVPAAVARRRSAARVQSRNGTARVTAEAPRPHAQLLDGGRRPRQPDSAQCGRPVAAANCTVRNVLRRRASPWRSPRLERHARSEGSPPPAPHRSGTC